MTEPLLDVRNVTLQYRTTDRIVTATHRVSFSVLPADRFVLLGPSGCGKSSLLKAVGGYLDPVEGEFSLRGRRIRGPGPDRMMVFQEFDQLLPWKTVLRQRHVPAARDAAAAAARSARSGRRHYIAKVGLDRFADAYPHTLSGGMKQRVAIARAMAMEPRDPADGRAVRRTRRADPAHACRMSCLRLWDDTNFTVLFVTHSINEAIRIGNRILLLSPHPGRVRAELDSMPRDNSDAAAQLGLEQRIHDLLFA